jgi:hypothetical protein
VDQLSEAAFSAGQKANQVFEARLAEARALVEQSSQMVEEAGAATARKLEEGAAAARASLGELQAMMTEIEQRVSGLPAAARGQADLVRTAVGRGMDELMAQARRTADEAQAIDAAFQARVRRNFEMLSEAVRLMGTVAAVAPEPLAPPLASLAEPPTPREPPPKEGVPGFATAQWDPVMTPTQEAEPPRTRWAQVGADAAAPEVESDLELELEDIMEPAAAPAQTRVVLEAAVAEEPAKTALVEPPALRPRLKLTPTASDEEFSAVFAAAGGPPADGAEPAGDAEWTWKDLLASIDGADAEGERLQDQLAAELSRMGVDAAKLLPKARVDEIAAAVQTGDRAGAREVVKRLAPAAIRRIGRRLFTDEGVKRKVQVYVRRYQTLVDDAVVRDPEGFLMASLLGDEAGRLYLLLDAAAGDVV